MLIIFHCSLVSFDTAVTRFKVPAGYHQVKVQPGSFAGYLQNLPLKPAGTPARTYRGNVAKTDAESAAVVDISIGNQDPAAMRRCGDALARRIFISAKSL